MWHPPSCTSTPASAAELITTVAGGSSELKPGKAERQTFQIAQRRQFPPVPLSHE